MYYLLFILLTVPLLAQEGSSIPSPTPQVLATPAIAAPEAAPQLFPGPTPEASPQAAPEATPMPAASPAEGKTAGEDVIALPSDSGAVETPMVSDTEVVPSKPSGADVPDAAFADPNAVIPSDADVAPPAPMGPSASEIARKLKIRYQEVRVEVEKDPAVRSLREQAQSAKSFEDERAALREYYRLLFKKIRKVDKALSARCDALEAAYIGRLVQSRLEPTIPLNPPPVPEPLQD